LRLAAIIINLVVYTIFMSRNKRNKSNARESMFAVRLSVEEMRMFKRLCNILEMNKSEMVRHLVSREYDKLRKQIKIGY